MPIACDMCLLLRLQGELSLFEYFVRLSPDTIEYWFFYFNAEGDICTGYILGCINQRDTLCSALEIFGCCKFHQNDQILQRFNTIVFFGVYMYFPNRYYCKPCNEVLRPFSCKVIHISLFFHSTFIFIILALNYK